MKKFVSSLLALLMGTVAASAQQLTPPPPGGSWNPYLIQGFVSPAPMLPAEFNGTGTLTFDVGNTGSSDIVWVTNQEMLITLSLSYGVPNVADPNDPLQAITAVSGPGAAWFNWEYFPAQRTFRGTQKATIPGNSRQTINIAYKVVENSFNTQTFQNGFNSNISPPAYTNPQPTDDDTVAAYTYVQAFDFGDAPASYGSARHEIDLTKQTVLDPNDDEIEVYNRYVYLGNGVDPESANQPSLNALGDDTNQTGGLAVDDEDGVVIPMLSPGQPATINYTVSVVDEDYFSGQLRFSAWIDWNADGDFLDAGERLASNQLLGSSGPQTLSFTVPADAVIGNTMARFRVGPTVGTLSAASPTANAAYGEVEDYQVNINTASADLAILKTVNNSTPNVGSNVTFTLAVTNNGPSNASGVTVNDLLPSGYTYVSSVPSTGTYVSGTGVWTVGNLNNGANATLDITATVNASGNYVNNSSVTGNEFDPDLNNNQDPESTTPVPQADLAILKTVNNSTPNVGTNVTFTLAVTNNGPSNATGVTVNDLLPSGYSYVSNLPSIGSYNNVSGVWTIGNLANGAGATLQITATVNASGFYLNNASVTGNQPDPNTTNNQDSESTTPFSVGTVTGRVYIDTNGNGTQDIGELGVANLDIVITDVNNSTQTVVTDSNGNWTASVATGVATIDVSNSDPQYPTGYTQTEGTDPNNVTVLPSQSVNGGTDGFFLPGTISGITQVDTDIDDIGDLTLNNVTYRLLNFSDDSPVDDPNQAGVQPYVIVSTNGMYAFSNLPPGQYVVVQDQPSGFVSQRDWDSTADAGSSPVDPANTSRTDNRIPVDLAFGETDNGNNFVEYRCPTTFAAWQLIHPTAGGNDANPDGDLYTNVLEYAFCMPPNNGLRAAFCVVDTGSNYDIVFHRVAGGPTDLTYFLRYTGALSTPAVAWTEVSLASLGASVTITPDAGGLSEQVRITNIKNLVPVGSERGFYQIAVKLDSNADSTIDVIDYTYTEGWQEVTIEANECETYSNPFLPCPQFVGVVDSMTGLTLNLTTSAPGVDFTPSSGTLAPLPTRYRIEVQSGPLNGQRFDIATGGVSSLTLETDTNTYTGPPFNSLSTSTGTLQAQLTGAQIMLVKYRTVEELVPVAQMNATSSPNTADRVLYNDGIAGWLTYWAFDNGGSPFWRLQGSGNNDRSTDAVAAQQGFFIHTRANAEVIRSYGMVRQSNFAQPISTSVPMFGSPYPMPLTPTQMAYLPAGFTGSRDPASSDQVLHWTRDGVLPDDNDGYSAFWLTKTTSPLRNQWSDLLDTGLTNQNNNPFIRAGRAYWFIAKAARPDHLVPLPWTLPVRFDNNVAP
jgi:uncharacterized repeat protein (TIGR01451 family)